MAAYYNEIDPFCVVWLKNLIRFGLIPNGDVDDRDIRTVEPVDLVGYTQCHFFAGIAGWSRALRIAEWPEDCPVWTGSCPCQFKSSAARGRNVADDLWEPYRRLIAARNPATVFGEQVANAGRWFDGVCDDLEALDYTIGAAVLPACSVGQDHQRYRLYFVGHADRHRQSGLSVHEEVDRLPNYRGHPRSVADTYGVSERMATLRAYGNAIVPQVAAAFIEAYMSIDEAVTVAAGCGASKNTGRPFASESSSSSEIRIGETKGEG